MFAKSATLQLHQQFADTFFPLKAKSRVSDVPYFRILPHFCLATAVITSPLLLPLQTSLSPSLTMPVTSGRLFT